MEAGIRRVPFDPHADARRIVLGVVDDGADGDGVDAKELAQPTSFARPTEIDAMGDDRLFDDP